MSVPKTKSKLQAIIESTIQKLKAEPDRHHRSAVDREINTDGLSTREKIIVGLSMSIGKKWTESSGENTCDEKILSKFHCKEFCFLMNKKSFRPPPEFLFLIAQKAFQIG
jgi:hypothetical protein